ncbi:hypothetical protein [Parasutterella sp.]|uniref:hypothetical protein n=1 Tax=Parasutterella sp. TaxID=2049037 RepID=UPI003995CDB0
MPSGTPAAEYSLVNFGADTEKVLNNWIEPFAQSLMDGVNGIIITVFTVGFLAGYRSGASTRVRKNFFGR